MRLLLQTTNLLAVLSSATAAAIEGRATACNADHVNFVNQRAHHAVYFCDFYLSTPRVNSPFALLGASDLWNACGCIAAAASTPRNYHTVTAPSDTSCSAYTKILADEYYYPPNFCSFYMLIGRTRSTIPGVSVADLQKACNCLNAATTTSQAATTTTTITSTASYVPTITSTCSDNALTTAVGNFISGLASWTAVAYPTAYASVATGNSYDSSGSAALLTCQYSSTADAHASICSPELPVCPGQNYTVSFKYKFPSSGSSSGNLGLYNYGWDEMLESVSGPVVGSSSDGAGVSAGSWGIASQTFEAVQDDDMICILLQCLSSKSLTGETAMVTVDNVRVTRAT